MLTRQQQEKVFEYVLKAILCKKDNSIVTLKNEGVTTMEELIQIPPPEVNSFTMPDKSKLPVYACATIKILIKWNVQLLAVTGDNEIDWKQDVTNVTKETFKHFWVKIIPNNLQQSRAPPNSSVSRPSTTNMIEQELKYFQHIIKQDKSQYKPIENKDSFDEWKRSSLATISAHWCEHITNPAYTPNTPSAKMLFQEQQRFMYDVFTFILQTSMRRNFIWKHENIKGTTSGRNMWTTWSHLHIVKLK